MSTGHSSPGYGRFFAMIATAMAAMYAMTYLNTYTLDHVFYSQSRLYMIGYMGAAMAIVMLAFMAGMYADRAANFAIVAGATIVFVASVWAMRSQTGIDDALYMRAMIPHHSIAILTSERAKISDPRVRALADGIIEAQRREIGEMKALLIDLAGGPRATPEVDGQ